MPSYMEKNHDPLQVVGLGANRISTVFRINFTKEQIMKITSASRLVFSAGFVAIVAAPSALAERQQSEVSLKACRGLPGHAELKVALIGAVADETSGLNLHMWGSIIARDGTVCAVAFSGENSGSQWPGSRVISAQKANTANAFSLANTQLNGSGAAGLALSAANLYSAVQPGGSLYGLQHSNPVDTEAAYGGRSAFFGTPWDPMVGTRIGGVNVFGGGLPMYAAGGKIVDAVGVSGDTSCADHRIGWRVRHNLGLDYLAAIGGVSGDATRPDNIVFDIGPDGKSAGGFGHPECLNTDKGALPTVQ
jgi:uncharacterized protein GlcG (DUF336 family)